MSKVFSVSNSEELKNALASATGGDTIELAGGDYGKLELLTFKTFGIKAIYDSPVTITSADPNDKASFSGMDLREVKNLTFEDVTFDSNYTGGDVWVSPFSISASTGITIRDSLFQGELASGTGDSTTDGFATGKGLTVGGSSGIVIENNEFTTWHRALTVGGSQDVTVAGNDVHSIRSDGMNFVKVQNVVIEDNYIHDFIRSKESLDHSDMIQFWTNGTNEPSTDIVIRGNTLDMGDGDSTQSIFMRNDMVDRGLAGEEMFYRNILIENNTIYNAHNHGITVGETNGLTVKSNTVVLAGNNYANEIASITIPKINLKSASTAVTIESNITSTINGFSNQADWSVDSNALIQPSDYLEHFITSTIATHDGAHEFSVIPGTLIEQLGAGSDLVQFADAPDALSPQFLVRSDEASGQTLILDASLTMGPTGFVSESDTDFLWTFGDGSTATGRIVKHEFVSPGHHDVTLTVIAKDGTTAQAQFTAGIAGDGLVQFDSQAGLFEALTYGEETPLDGSGLPLQKTVDGYALKLGGEGSQASVAASELSQFFGTESFEMSMSLKADSAASWGEVARIHASFMASVDQDGNFRLELFLDDGARVQMISDGIDLNDGAVHDVTVRFDGKAGFAEILADGQVVASEAVSGSLGGGTRALDFGNPWGKQNFDGELSAFSLSADSKDFPIYDGEAVPSSTETGTPETAPEEEPVVDSGEPITSEPTEPEDTTTSRESDPALTEPVEEPAPEEESSLPEPLLNGGYQLDFASITMSNTVLLLDDTHLVETEDGPALSFDGKKDFVSLGRLTEFENSQKLAFSVDFVSDNTDGGAERLVWNHMKLGLTLEGDGLRIHAQNNDEKFHQGFQVDGLGLNDGNLHNATVMVDAGTDRLQVVVNDTLILDEQGTDFNFVGAGGQEWGWSLGTAWNRWFEGEVHDFQVSDDFDFIETTAADDTALL